MGSNVVTIKQIALQAGVSIATVSMALRRSPKIRAATAERVREIARDLGYTPNPLVSALMARIRESAPSQDQVAIAAIYLGDDERRAPNTAFLAEIFAGAQERAERLGFRLALFRSREKGLSERRLRDILLSRGIYGLMVLPSSDLGLKLELDWGQFAAVAIGYSLVEPALHRVVPDHFQELSVAFERLGRLGYRRIGLLMDTGTDLRVRHKWAALLEWHNGRIDPSDRVPLSLVPEITRDAFLRWFEQHRPDVVLSPRQWVVDWMEAEGLQLPRDVGFAHLNWTERSAPCSGIDQRAGLLGAAAVESVVAQLHRNERGLPTVAQSLAIEGVWIDGPTTRDRSR
ncbi:MAG TPA: LacI family DNA-binding transcriptional regulator [Opitutaceae bacterium]|nr:LacI family DNA-binding transcriptional regulator [Opitutaceae bacterium]